MIFHRHWFHDEPLMQRGVCFVDPITLGTLAVGALGSFAASSMASKGSSAPAPAAAPPPMAPPPQNPVGSATSKQQKTPSFIGTAAVPDQKSFGQKTLIGQ